MEKDIKKKNIGGVFALYPTPIGIIGTEVNGKVNWINIAHLGVVGMDKIMLSMHKSHYSNQGIRENKTASVNLVTKDMIIEADYVGMVSGHKVDKSKVFEYFYGKLKAAPLIKSAVISMECELVDIYETEEEDNFILKVINTYVDDNVLNANGTIDYSKVKPLLFEMPTKSYLEPGNIIGKCWNEGNKYNK
ncbi:flavin reductase family protein [Clostridium cochlearium]|uniref:flavin reductase family protein n=1 Tax=Clostridium cochlearium TaxID=1494 RepID=UPI000B94C3CD|nr:flavin reductase family protein [Clostridium cochlearium]MBV1821376.1 flavin reductase family protein [Bacteroidales bacterium MSK.15.36]MCG4572553.1 flavin reductase family protein [Clostridium cochlearium]MDU1443394.1 flavin reductase family protein [Clostridium cochlearium]SNV82966.1 conserved protein of DIM6/NTAB family [Clostridium cochlearium]STA93059.1 conserved protein of DIM6/NTAB family [Clostridium cochlearium]